MIEKKKLNYRKPELRVYGEMEHLTRIMSFGLYPDRLGNLSFDEPKGQMKGWMMNMS